MSDKKKILIVEDDSITAILLKEILEKEGYDIIGPARNSKEAFNLFSKYHPDLVLMDIILGEEIDGIEIVTQLKKIRHVSVIYLTASTDRNHVQKAKKTLPSAFLIKPVDEFQLKSTIEMILEKDSLRKVFIAKEKKYQSLFYHMTNGFIHLKILFSETEDRVEDAEIIDINQSAMNLLNISLEIDEKPLVTLLFPNLVNIAPDWREQLYKIAKHDESKAMQLYTKNLKKWFKLLLFTTSQDDIAILLEDITESKIAQKELEESEEKFRKLSETAQDGIIILDNRGLITDWNQSSEIIFGYTEKEIKGKTLHQLLAPSKEYQKFIENFQKWQKTGKGNAVGKTLELPALRKDGKRITIELSLTSVPINDLWCAMGIVRDVSERISNESEMKRVHSEIHNLFSSIDSILIGVSLKDTITHWNSEAEKIFGLSAREVHNKKITELNLNWEWKKITEGIALCLLEERKVSLSDIVLIKKDEEKILGITINPVLNDNSVIEGFLIFGKDITDKKIIEMQLLQDQKLKSIGELASGIAHEINTPSQYVSNNLFFLMDEFNKIIQTIEKIKSLSKITQAPDLFNALKDIENLIEKLELKYISKEVPEALEQSIEGMKKISTIVHSMKNFVHPGGDERIFIKINETIDDTITISRNEWKYNAEINTDLDQRNPEILCIPAEINQVLLNLIINASHAINDAIEKKMISNGKISISTAIDKSNLIVTISDNGTGIPQNIRNRVFDPFFTTKGIGKGTGQGLAISYSIIVDKYGGKLYFKTKENKGTSFIIELPLKNK